MNTKTENTNFGTGIAIGLPFLILGMIQQNIAFFTVGIALALSLSASPALAAAKKKRKQTKK